jgi:hypothetical protein
VAAARTLGFALPLLVLLAGCQLYWIKPGADMAAFTGDHQGCVKTAGVPVGDGTRVLVNLDLYRACLRTRGWQRETGSSFGNPKGYYRGQENEGPIALTDVPEQTRTVDPPTRPR